MTQAQEKLEDGLYAAIHTSRGRMLLALYLSPHSHDGDKFWRPRRGNDANEGSDRATLLQRSYFPSRGGELYHSTGLSTKDRDRRTRVQISR